MQVKIIIDYIDSVIEYLFSPGTIEGVGETAETKTKSCGSQGAYIIL